MSDEWEVERMNDELDAADRQIEEPGKWAVVKVTYAEGKKPYGRESFLYDWYVRTDARSDADCNWTSGNPWMHSWGELLSYGDVEVMSHGYIEGYDDGYKDGYLAACAEGDGRPVSDGREYRQGRAEALAEIEGLGARTAVRLWYEANPSFAVFDEQPLLFLRHVMESLPTLARNHVADMRGWDYESDTSEGEK